MPKLSHNQLVARSSSSQIRKIITPLKTFGNFLGSFMASVMGMTNPIPSECGVSTPAGQCIK